MHQYWTIIALDALDKAREAERHRLAMLATPSARRRAHDRLVRPRTRRARPTDRRRNRRGRRHARAPGHLQLTPASRT